MSVRLDDVPNKQEVADSKDEGEYADDHVVFRKATFDGITVGSTRHAHDSKSVHWPEGCIVCREADQEMPQAECLIKFLSCCLRIPIVDTGKQSKDRSADEDIMEVSDDEV